ncbi:MAG TPA: hypothetical protein VGY31_05110 [Terriglobia bacterium]|nr:hypothetical protein [Terriglobia bacterium]
MDSAFLRQYFSKNGSAGLDRRDRPETFAARVREAAGDPVLGRELITNGVFATGVANVMGIQEYRRLMDRPVDKTPALLATESFVRSQGREPYASKPVLGNHPEAFPLTALHRTKAATPPAPDVVASDTLRILAGLPEGVTVPQVLEKLSDES